MDEYLQNKIENKFLPFKKDSMKIFDAKNFRNKCIHFFYSNSLAKIKFKILTSHVFRSITQVIQLIV